MEYSGVYPQWYSGISRGNKVALIVTKCKFLCLTVRPNKPQHWCLEQENFIAWPSKGECVANAQNPELSDGFQEEVL